mmetsp:Transcript_14484/g.50938  ORF Transcript_14484/g.50938 Transcript_14484/m.50938 type:complete len:237 (+) Transcript_14484:8216-8926(+)
MHLDGDQSHELRALHLRQGLADHVAQVADVLALAPPDHSQRVLLLLLHLLQRARALGRPLDLARGDEKLARKLLDPLVLSRFRGHVHVVALDENRPQRHDHGFLAGAQPDLDGALELYGCNELDLLRIRSNEPNGLPTPVLGWRLQLQILDALEALLDVFLHQLRVPGLAQNLEQVVVGQEVEAREGLSFFSPSSRSGTFAPYPATSRSRSRSRAFEGESRPSSREARRRCASTSR